MLVACSGLDWGGGGGGVDCNVLWRDGVGIGLFGVYE